MALLFEKQSLRTRVSFEAAMIHLGGSSLFLGQDVGFGSRESIADFGRVLSEYVDVIVLRANSHMTAVDLAEHSNCSVINGLTDFGHPCQAMADLYTIRELVGGRLEGRTIAWVGDANNVARSVALGCGKLGLKLVMAVPQKYQYNAKSLAWLREQVPALDHHGDNRSDRGRQRCRGDLHRRLGQHGPGSRARGPPGRFRPLSGERPLDVPCRRKGLSSCTVCRPAAAKR